MSFAKRDATRTASNVNPTTSSTVGKRTLTDHLQPLMRVGASGDHRLIQRQDTGGSQPTEQQTDAEGNHCLTASGKPYLPRAPVIAVPGHSGKYEALPANPKATYDSLRAQVLAVKQTQLTTANQLSGGVVPPRDYNYWFAKVYYFVTQHELEAIDSARYQYPLMKLQEVIWFQNAYAANLAAWQSGQRANCEPHWRQAFDNAQRMQSAQVDATTQTIGTVAGAGGGAVGGAAAGAAIGGGIGALFFGIGAIPGAAIAGGIGGLLGGLF